MPSLRSSLAQPSYRLLAHESVMQSMQHSVDTAHVKSSEAWKTMNPLNSPLLKDFFPK